MCICIRICTCISICTCMYMYMYMCTYVYVYIYIHISIVSFTKFDRIGMLFMMTFDEQSNIDTACVSSSLITLLCCFAQMVFTPPSLLLPNQFDRVAPSLWPWSQWGWDRWHGCWSREEEQPRITRRILLRSADCRQKLLWIQDDALWNL